ncbi:MAG: phosphotransferase, partial [Mycobacteriales bacterium]
MSDQARAALAAALDGASSAAGELLHPQRRGAWQANQVAIGATVVAYLGADEPSRARIRSERLRLGWAAAAGVPVPAVRAQAADDAWLLVQRVPDDEVYGPTYVDAAVAAAAAVRLAGAPPPHVGIARSRRAHRSDLMVRVTRAVLSPLRLTEFRALRAEVAAVPEDRFVTSHGDFHIGNVLSDTGSSVSVVDFEFLGRGHPADDLMSLWVDLVDPADRQRLLR